MATDMIPAVYTNGTFQVLAPLPDLPEKQVVKLFYVVTDAPSEDTSKNELSNTDDQSLYGELTDDDLIDEEFIEMFGPSPKTVEERIAFVHKMAGIWSVDDDELLHWIAESPEADLYNDKIIYESQ